MSPVPAKERMFLLNFVQASFSNQLHKAPEFSIHSVKNFALLLFGGG